MPGACFKAPINLKETCYTKCSVANTALESEIEVSLSLPVCETLVSFKCSMSVVDVRVKDVYSQLFKGHKMLVQSQLKYLVRYGEEPVDRGNTGSLKLIL